MDELIPIQFSKELLNKSSVQNFDCGTEPHEIQIGNWLRCDKNGAVREIEDGGKVWLYLNRSNELVGVGGIAKAKIRWPKNSSEKMNCTCITFIGVKKTFQGKGIGSEILRHLITQSFEFNQATPMLIVLYVRDDNKDGMRWYKKNGFSEIGKPYVDSNSVVHHRMVREVDIQD